MSLFHCLLRGASSRNTPPGDPSGGVVYLRIILSQEEASRHVSITKYFFSRGGVVSTSPKPQTGGPPLVSCPQLLIQYIRSYPPYRRPFLYPQPENAPCRGDRDPLITWLFSDGCSVLYKETQATIMSSSSSLSSPSFT